MKTSSYFAVLAAGLLLTAGQAFSQEDPSQVGATAAKPGNMTGRDFVETAMMSDMFEIQAGRLAASQGSSEQVRQFGQQMVDAHTQTTAKLKSAVDRTVVNQQVTPPPQLDPAHMQMYSQLQAVHGAAFDRLYVQQQIAAHQQALAVMSGFASNGREAELKAVAAQTVPIIQDHLRMLQQIKV